MADFEGVNLLSGYRRRLRIVLAGQLAAALSVVFGLGSLAVRLFGLAVLWTVAPVLAGVFIWCALIVWQLMWEADGR